jgi:hypothetical protein
MGCSLGWSDMLEAQGTMARTQERAFLAMSGTSLYIRR